MFKISKGLQERPTRFQACCGPLEPDIVKAYPTNKMLKSIAQVITCFFGLYMIKYALYLWIYTAIN